MANPSSKKVTRSYEEIKQSIIKGRNEIIKKESDLKAELIEAIIVLRTEKKDKKRATEQIKNDFVHTNLVSRTTAYDAIKEVYEPEEWAKSEAKKEEKVKQVVTVAQGGQQETENDTEDRDSIREKAKKNLLNKSIGGTERKLKKESAVTVGSDLLQNEQGDDQDDTEEENENRITYDTEEQLRPSQTRIVIDDMEQIQAIKNIIDQGDALVIIINEHNECEAVESGIKLKAVST